MYWVFVIVGALLWIGTLGLIILFIYAEGTFAFLANEFDNRDSNNVLFCSSLAQCFITVLRYGLPDPISLVSKHSNDPAKLQFCYRLRICHKNLRVLHFVLFSMM